MPNENNLILSPKEEALFNGWTKEQIYEAYLSEHEARVLLNQEVNRLGRRLAEIKFMAGKND